MRTICGKLTLCEEHFEHNQFMNPSEKGIFKPRKRLIHTAVPTIFNTLRHPPHHATIRTLPPFGNQEHITTHATKAGKVLMVTDRQPINSYNLLK